MMARTPRKGTPQTLENAALFYLGRFASSSENLRRVLMRRVERSARVHGTDRDEGRRIAEVFAFDEFNDPADSQIWSWTEQLHWRGYLSGLPGGAATAQAQSVRQKRGRRWVLPRSK